MRSFTLLFKRLFPARAAMLLGLALVTLVAEPVYTFWLNPEIRLFTYAASVKRAWAEKMRSERGEIIIVFGGSSSAFSIDGERMLIDHQMPVANFGMHAGMGALFLTGFAVDAARSGDTLLMAIEPELLMDQFSSPDMAAQIGLALGQPELVHASNFTGEPIHWVEDLACRRPGSYHVCMLLAKIAFRKPLYTYGPRDLTASGWMQTAKRSAIAERKIGSGKLSGDARRLLTALRQWGEENGVTVLYSLPWSYASQLKLSDLQQMNRNFLYEVSEFIPVLKDSNLGAYPVREHFSDTHWHLTREGAAARTDSLAIQLKHRLYWTREELLQKAGP